MTHIYLHFFNVTILEHWKNSERLWFLRREALYLALDIYFVRDKAHESSHYSNP